MKRMFLMLVLLTAVILSSSLIVTSRAADYTKIGVKVGDRADYSSDFVGGTDRQRIEITEVTGFFVNLTRTYYWSNGTVEIASWARGNVSNGHFVDLLVCAGLRAGDPLYEGAPYLFNSTFSMEIAGATRTVNELVLDDWHGYYDQATGILARMSAPGSWNLTMISTNMWAGADMTILLVVGAVAAVAVVAVVAVGVIRWRVRKYQGIGVAEPTFRKTRTQ